MVEQPCYIAVFFSISTDFCELNWRPNNPWISMDIHTLSDGRGCPTPKRQDAGPTNNGHFWYVTAGSKLMILAEKR